MKYHGHSLSIAIATIVTLSIVIVLYTLSLTGHIRTEDSTVIANIHPEIVYVPDTSTSTNLKTAFKVGVEIGNPETIQAILLQETGGNNNNSIGNKGAPVGKRSYGLMQVQVVAAKEVLTQYPSMLKVYFEGKTLSTLSDEQIIAVLLTNQEANIYFASYLFKYYLQLCNGNWDKAVASYNMGIGGVEQVSNYNQVDYVVSVKGLMESKVRPFNKRNNLTLTQRF